MKENIEAKVRREIAEKEKGYRDRRAKRLAGGTDIVCTDCDGAGIIRVNILYTSGQLGYDFHGDGTRSGHGKEIECPRCKGQGQFDPEKDKLTQEIKHLIAEDKR